MINKEKIIRHLHDEYKDVSLKVFDTLDSTNLEAKRMVDVLTTHGTTIVADTQTQGRGRLGRSFFSPEETGIYMTMLLEAKEDMAETVMITTAASVAVCRAIKEVCDLECQIKWVNDIYLNDRKICGILAEAITDADTGKISHIALGIGVNCTMPKEGFPSEFEHKAGSLVASSAVHDAINREALIAEIACQVLELYSNLESREFIGDYKARSIVLGKEVKVFKQHQEGQSPDFDSDGGLIATAIDIDQDGGLIVRYENGENETLNTGEISIRL